MDPRARFIIINFDILDAHATTLRRHGFGCLIVDEAHRIKNPRAQRTRALLGLARTIPRKALLSGTLLMNRPEELWVPLSIVRPQAFPDFDAFAKRYTQSRSVRVRVRGRWQQRTVRDGGRHLDELRRRMQAFTIRRTLAEVREDLPEVHHQVLPVRLGPSDQEAHDDAARGVGHESDAAATMRRVHAMMAVCRRAKRAAILEAILERTRVGRKVLVFSEHLDLLDEIQRHLGISCLRIDGSVPTARRQDIEARFQQDPEIKVFLGQVRACSEALTLDAADTVVIADADWSPQANEQAIRRCLRIGTRHGVEVLWPVAMGTLDERRLEVLRSKRDDFETLMASDVVAASLAALPARHIRDSRASGPGDHHGTQPTPRRPASVRGV